MNMMLLKVVTVNDVTLQAGPNGMKLFTAVINQFVIIWSVCLLPAFQVQFNVCGYENSGRLQPCS